MPPDAIIPHPDTLEPACDAIAPQREDTHIRLIHRAGLRVRLRAVSNAEFGQSPLRCNINIHSTFAVSVTAKKNSRLG